MHLYCGQSVKSMNITSCVRCDRESYDQFYQAAVLRDVGTQVRMKIPAAIWGDPIEQHRAAQSFFLGLVSSLSSDLTKHHQMKLELKSFLDR